MIWWTTGRWSPGSLGGPLARFGGWRSAARTAIPRLRSRRRSARTAAVPDHLLPDLSLAHGGRCQGVEWRVERWSCRRRGCAPAGEPRARRPGAARNWPELDVGSAARALPRKLKCLHAHAAFALARPGYELGDEVLDEAGERWCPDGRCARALQEAAPS